MKPFKGEIIGLISALIVLGVAAGIVYAANVFNATGGGAVTQITTNWGECQRITNNSTAPLFVPANTQAEWNAFLTYAPNKTISSCCAANQGQACTSGANSCGMTNSGTIQCDGSCNASVPSNSLCPVYGCMDSGAANYNPSATINNGSCTYWAWRWNRASDDGNTYGPCDYGSSDGQQYNCDSSSVGLSPSTECSLSNHNITSVWVSEGGFAWPGGDMATLSNYVCEAR